MIDKIQEMTVAITKAEIAIVERTVVVGWLVESTPPTARAAQSK